MNSIQSQLLGFYGELSFSSLSLSFSCLCFNCLSLSFSDLSFRKSFLSGGGFIFPLVFLWFCCQRERYSVDTLAEKSVCMVVCMVIDELMD